MDVNSTFEKTGIKCKVLQGNYPAGEEELCWKSNLSSIDKQRTVKRMMYSTKNRYYYIREKRELYIC